MASSQKKVINDLKKLEAFLGTETKDLGSRTATLVKESQEIVSKTFSISLVALGLSLTGIILLGLALSHSILDPIDRLVELLKKMSRGDLSSRLEVRGKDELALLADHFNRFLDHITSLVGQVRNSAKEVDGAAGSLDTLARQMLSEAKHSVAVAETAIGETERLVEFMKETSQMIESLAAATREISQNTTTAAGVARDLAQSMDETREIITHLSQQTQKIGSVIELIRSIAEQTSLLALNATIEAARAGEAGKGFAVVAGEVKELARQTAQATEEIAPIIEGILKEVNRAVKSVEANVEGTSRMQDAANTVATAVEEQTATYQEINHQVHNGSQMTEEVRIHIETLSQEAAQNLKEAQELTKRAEFLRSQSHRLEKMVRGLKV
ncbi:methyl-accepting chemotaxis protein [Thermosulfuriphilus sp.]